MGSYWGAIRYRGQKEKKATKTVQGVEGKSRVDLKGQAISSGKPSPRGGDEKTGGKEDKKRRKGIQGKGPFSTKSNRRHCAERLGEDAICPFTGQKRKD